MTSESPQVIETKKARFNDWLWRKPTRHESVISCRLRIFFRIISIFVREFVQDSIPLRASALTFTIILSMVPVLALSTAVLKGLGAGNQMRAAAYKFIETIESTTTGLDTDAPPAHEPVTAKPPAPSVAAETTAPANNAETLPKPEPDDKKLDLTSNGEQTGVKEQIPPQTAPDTAKPAKQPQSGIKAAEKEQSLTSHLKRATDTIFNYVDRTNFAALGIFGIAGLFVTVISVLGTIEQAMNAVWQAESSRGIGRKIMDYLALMLLLPLAVNIGLATMAVLQSKTTLDILQHIFPMAWAGPLLVRSISYSFLVMTLLILYRFLPNSRVPLVPALIGALFGAIGWLSVQSFFIWAQIGVAKYNAIYGSFATLPLFLLWIYIGWIVFLSGAEVAFAVQVYDRYDSGANNQKLTPRIELALAYDLMNILFADFQSRRTSNIDSISQRLDYTYQSIIETLKKLTSSGLVRSVEGDETAFVPASPAEQIPASEILKIIFGSSQPATRGGAIAKKAFTGAQSALGDAAMDKVGRATKPEA